MTVKGNFTRILNLNKRLRALANGGDLQIALHVARRGASLLRHVTSKAFADRETVYGDPRPLGKYGDILSLVASGATQRSMTFYAHGTKIRAILGTTWAKYLIGKYKVLPSGYSEMPVRWQQLLEQNVMSELRSRGWTGDF